MDEEIDVPNSPLDEYMRQFYLHSDVGLQAIASSHETKEAGVVVAEKWWKRLSESLRWRLFFDDEFIRGLFTTSSFTQVLTEEDECLLYDEFLSRSMERQQLMSSVFLFLVVPFLCVQKYAFRFLFKMFFTEIYSYMSLVQSLVSYLKQVQLLRLSVVSGSAASGEELNVKYRRLLFEHLRSEYICLRDSNLQLASHLKEKVKLMCTIEDSELSDVLKFDGNEEKVTNGYHLSVLNCLIKLNYLQMSEMLKLTLLCYMQADPIVFYKLLFNMFSAFRSFRCKNTALKSMIDICKLKTVEPSVEKHQSGGQQALHVNSLSLHLRNALLNSYRILEKPGEEVELLKVIQYELDFCLLYVKQIKNESDPAAPVQPDLLSISAPQRVAAEVQLKQDDAKTDVDKCDVIFEALSNENNTNEWCHDDNDDESDNVQAKLEAREHELLNSNFNTELRQALAKKQSEWSEREKQAKVVKDEKLVEYEKQFINSSNLLIDANDLLKYKSQLRNRKRQKYEYKQEDDDEEKHSFLTNNNAFLAEFKAKKSEFTDDEIVYE